MKVGVIGGGSSYTPELVGGFLERMQQLPIDELCLMDNDPERLEVVGGFARRMVAAAKSPFEVTLTTDQRTAIEGCAYVISQLRVGGMAARREDEYLGLRHNLIGQETTGIGGLAMGMRAIPVLLEIANDIRELAPDALLVNFANPAGLVTQALALHAPEVQSVGVCNAPIGMVMACLRGLKRQGVEARFEQAQLDTLGLNHLTWYRGFCIDGEEMWPRILEAYLARLRKSPRPDFDPDLIESLGMIPNSYLQYFYGTEDKLAEQARWPPSRAEEVMKIEETLLRQYAEPDRSEPPEGLKERGGADYSTVATQLLNAHHNDLGEVHVLNVPHRGAVEGWNEDWVLEMPCKVNRAGIEPLPAEPLPGSCLELVQKVKQAELYAVEAAVTGERQLARNALAIHPLGPKADQLDVVLDDLLSSHRSLLPAFFEDA